MFYTKDYNNIIDSYLENCTDKEWNYLLKKYNIKDSENYMGEVREQIEHAILQDYQHSSFNEQVKMLVFFEKYRKTGKEEEKEQMKRKNINDLNILKKKILQEDIDYLKKNNILSVEQIIYNNEEFEKYKEWHYKTKKGEEVEIVSVWPTDYGDMGCSAVLYKNKIPVAKIYDSYEKNVLKEVFAFSEKKFKEKMMKKSFKSLILDNFNSYIELPKISECSEILQEVFDCVCNSDSGMCHIDYNDWKDYYSDKFTEEDLEVLKNEIKKYKLDDVIEVDNGEYQILGYSNLQYMFNDTREFEKESGLQIE